MRKLAVTSALLFCLACGGAGTSSSSPDPAPTSEPTQTATNPTPDATPDATTTPQALDLDTPLRSALSAAGLNLDILPPPDPALISLGRSLMFDKLLSGNKDVACATCHLPSQQTSDGLSLSIGTGGFGLGPGRVLGAGKSFIGRNASELFNRGPVTVMFWDGRVSGTPAQGFQTPAGNQLPGGLRSALAAQAMFPVTARDEMRGNPGDVAVDGSPNELAAIPDNDFRAQWAALTARLTANPTYVAMFQAAFPDVPVNQLGFQHAANALAAFEASELNRLNSPFDRYLAGDNTALTPAQKRGALLFYGQARCAVCHRGGLLSDFAFHDVAFPQIGPGKGASAPLDLGRALETGNPGDRFRFRTPPLRNVALTGPWTHAGGYTTLEAVVRHYINPARALANYDPSQLAPELQGQVHVRESLAAGMLDNLDPALRPPNPLNEGEVSDLVEFLGALSDPAANDPPASVPSGLPVD